MKNENTILDEIAKVVEAGLEYNELTGFDVIASHQPSKATIIKPTLWVERVSSKRYGCQSRLPVKQGSALVEQETYYQDIIFQITALKKRHLETDDKDTTTASDVLNWLASYFNGAAGRAKLNENGYSCIRVTEVREPAFTSDSDLYEKTPSFDITINHVQTDSRSIPHVDEFEPEIRKV